MSREHGSGRPDFVSGRAAARPDAGISWRNEGRDLDRLLGPVRVADETRPQVIAVVDGKSQFPMAKREVFAPKNRFLARLISDVQDGIFAGEDETNTEDIALGFERLSEGPDGRFTLVKLTEDGGHIEHVIGETSLMVKMNQSGDYSGRLADIFWNLDRKYLLDKGMVQGGQNREMMNVQEAIFSSSEYRDLVHALADHLGKKFDDYLKGDSSTVVH